MLFSFLQILVGIGALLHSSAATTSPPETCSTTTAPLDNHLTLKYWNGRGLMEIARMTLAIAGKFPGDYENGKYDAPAADLESNLGRMPVISVDNSQSVGQSVAIYFYLATEMNLMGDSTMQAAQILSVGEHLREMMLAFKTVVPAGSDPTEEQLDTWFNGGATDVTGTADSSQRPSRYLTWWMGRIENALAGLSTAEGFAVGNRLSLADIMVYYYFAEELKDDEAGADIAQWRREPFGAKHRVDAALQQHPRLSASIESVRSNANFQYWLRTRGEQRF